MVETGPEMLWEVSDLQKQNGKGCLWQMEPWLGSGWFAGRLAAVSETTKHCSSSRFFSIPSRPTTAEGGEKDIRKKKKMKKKKMVPFCNRVQIRRAWQAKAVR